MCRLSLKSLNSMAIRRSTVGLPYLGRLAAICMYTPTLEYPLRRGCRQGRASPIRDGRVILSRNYGLADLETRAPITERTNFRLASLTKQFTATAVLLLVKQRKLELDGKVGRILPSLPAHARGVTVR